MNRFRLIMLVVAVGLPACGSSPAPREHANEEISLDVTSWTDRSELFMEYPPLVAGQSARFAVHLTRLEDFQPLTAGQPSLEFIPEAGGTATTLPGNDPSRPGAFRIEGTPPAAGRYRWALRVQAPNLTDRHDLGTVTVFPDQKSAAAAPDLHGPEDPAAISYLKEQQWTNEFGTHLAEDRELRTATRVAATIEPLSGGEALVAAPAAGRYAADALPDVGAFVRAGAVLGRLEPRLGAADDRAALQSALAEARAALDGAQAEERRTEQLLADRAIPARRVEDAKRTRTVAEARVRAAESRLAQRDETLGAGGGGASGNVFVLKAPIAGRIAGVMATLGAAYGEGAPLFKIVRTDRVELRALVPSADVAAARNTGDLAFEVPGRADPLPLMAHHMHDAGVLDPDTHSLPLQFEVENPHGQLLIGQSGSALLYHKERARVPALPKTAVLMEAGRPYVFVHVSGERFVRRYVDIATRDGDWVGLKGGVKTGERVVVRGAYEVQLASAAKGLPAEGHVH